MTSSPLSGTRSEIPAERRRTLIARSTLRWFHPGRLPNNAARGMSRKALPASGSRAASNSSDGPSIPCEIASSQRPRCLRAPTEDSQSRSGG
jgi:hypothetical protein